VNAATVGGEATTTEGTYESAANLDDQQHEAAAGVAAGRAGQARRSRESEYDAAEYAAAEYAAEYAAEALTDPTPAAFLEWMYAGRTGYAIVGNLRRSLNDKGSIVDGPMREGSFYWPDESDKMAAHALAAAGHSDVFITPTLSDTPTRDMVERQPQPGSLLYVDVDHGADDDIALLHRLAGGGGMLVASGSGPTNVHGYIRLDEDVAPEAWAHLNRRLVATVGGDASPSAPNGYLRLVGTPNHKAGLLAGTPPPTVTVIAAASDLDGTWPLKDLDALLAAVPSASRPEDPDSHAEPTPWTAQLVTAAEADTAIQRALHELAANTCGKARYFTVFERARDVYEYTKSGIGPGYDEATAMLTAAAETVGYEKSIPDRLAQAWAESGARYVLAEPAPLAEPSDDAGDREGAAQNGYRFTDAGNAARFVKLCGGTARFVPDWGRWIVYKEGMWTVDASEALVTEAAKRVAKSLFKMVQGLSGTVRTDVFKAGVRAESAAGISGMVRLARGHESIIVGTQQMDANPDILNVRNGTIDLRTGELRPHNPADLCTKQCPVDYDPNATAPLWDQCLRTWLPDADVREYVQREAGAGTTGHPTETLSVHYGTGANGKSKFFGAIQAVLGHYAATPHKSLLIVQKHDEHDTVKADLFRRRLAVAAETPQAGRLNEETVKHLTGGDVIKGRRMREDPWEFLPSHTLILMSNHRPEVSGGDEGIWRRLRIVPWTVTIPEADRDENLHAKLAAEASGTLRWLVVGAGRYLDEGLQRAPDAVRQATAEYRDAEDTPGRFIREMIVFAKGGSVVAPDVGAVHAAWCRDVGIDLVPSHWREVLPRLRALGAAQKRSHGQMRWGGLRLSDEAKVLVSTDRVLVGASASGYPANNISRGDYTEGMAPCGTRPDEDLI
jgi:putative DNA primase/helicase